MLQKEICTDVCKYSYDFGCGVSILGNVRSEKKNTKCSSVLLHTVLGILFFGTDVNFQPIYKLIFVSTNISSDDLFLPVLV